MVPKRMSRAKNNYNQVVFERRTLLAFTLLVGLSVCVWIVAVSTDHWLEAESPPDKKLTIVDHSLRNGTKIFKSGNMGLTKGCTEGFIQLDRPGTGAVTTPYSECTSFKIFSNEIKPKRERKPDTDDTLISLIQTQVSFAVISFFILVMGFSFSIYTFRNPRYMFKRLAGGIHFLSCACTMVVIQVLSSVKEYGSKRDTFVFPKFSDVSYGCSFMLACSVFIINFTAGVIFMLFSRKRKRDRAATDEFSMADEPTFIGR